jgi:hypothetical protein
MRKIEEHDGTVEQVTAALADEFNENIAQRGGEKYSHGFVVAMLECLVFHEHVGAPNFECWRPLEMELRYTKRGSHPTPGSELFDYEGVPVSVAPDRTVHSWPDEDAVLERSIVFLERVLTKGRPLSQRAFDSLRAKVDAASRARATGATNGR